MIWHVCLRGTKMLFMPPCCEKTLAMCRLYCYLGRGKREREKERVIMCVCVRERERKRENSRLVKEGAWGEKGAGS
jgi:hypothetical protein